MYRDMLTCPALRNRTTPARVIVDSKYFTNESSSIVDKKLITDRLRLELTAAANAVTTDVGGLVFVGRHYADMVEHERGLKDGGVVDQGTRPPTAAPFGGDFRLGGRIGSHDTVDPGTGEVARYHQIVFEMVDLESSQIVWGGMYEFKKVGRYGIEHR